MTITYTLAIVSNTLTAGRRDSTCRRSQDMHRVLREANIEYGLDGMLKHTTARKAELVARTLKRELAWINKIRITRVDSREWMVIE